MSKKKKVVAKKVVSKKKVVRKKAKSPETKMFAKSITAEPTVPPKVVPQRTWADILPEGAIRKMRSKEDWEAEQLKNNRV